MTFSAPIALFVFNRPWHTRQTVEALRNNEGASESELFVFCDGPRTERDDLPVDEVRQYVRTITGFKKITVVERDNNLGLARSIVSGVTEIVNTFGCIIVIEDDSVTSRFFLKFMNEALLQYKNAQRVMHVSGYMYPVKRPGSLPGSFFYRGNAQLGMGHLEEGMGRL